MSRHEHQTTISGDALLGQRLVATARRLLLEATSDDDEATVERQLVTVRAWASGLDRATYETHQAENGVYVESRPPDEIVEAMERGNEEVRRAHEAARLMVRYHIQPRRGAREPITADELVSDLAVAQEIRNQPSTLNPSGQLDEPAAVAAAALEAHLLTGVELPMEPLRFAAETVIGAGADEASRPSFESEESYFEQGADRSAARVLPLLLLPNAAALRAVIDGSDGSETFARTADAAARIARAVANEVRVHLARGLDRLWEAPCTADSPCHHATALQLAVETMRDCALGGWDPDTSRRRITVLADPVQQALADTPDDAIYFARLDGAIRALAPAAQAGICVSARARELLTVLLAAHRRSLLSYDRDMDHRGTHALIAARALLTIATDGEDAPVYEHVDAYADNPALLSGFMRALSAAAEESPNRAATAARMWPELVAHVIGLNAAGHTPFRHRHFGDDTLASLLPNLAGEVSYLYREFEKDPIVWWQPLSWQSTVEQWLPLAQGDPGCVDHLIGFLTALSTEDQARTGLPWVASLVLGDPGRVANRTFLLASWLMEVRSAASDAGILPTWQRVVDALVVAGVSRLAPYSE